MKTTLPACTQIVKRCFYFLVDIVPSFTDKTRRMDALTTAKALTETRSVAPLANRKGKSKGFSQAFELRQLAFETAMKFKTFSPVTDESATASAREISSLIRAWSEADEHVRLWLNKPSPRSLRPVAKVKRGPKPGLAPVPT